MAAPEHWDQHQFILDRQVTSTQFCVLTERVSCLGDDRVPVVLLREHLHQGPRLQLGDVAQLSILTEEILEKPRGRRIKRPLLFLTDLAQVKLQKS